MNPIKALVKLANELDEKGQINAANQIDKMIEDQQLLWDLESAIKPYAKEEDSLGTICPVCKGTGGDPENIEPWCPVCHGDAFLPPKAREVDESDIEVDSLIVNEGDIEEETPVIE